MAAITDSGPKAGHTQPGAPTHGTGSKTNRRSIPLTAAKRVIKRFTSSGQRPTPTPRRERRPTRRFDASRAEPTLTGLDGAPSRKRAARIFLELKNERAAAPRVTDKRNVDRVFQPLALLDLGVRCGHSMTSNSDD